MTAVSRVSGHAVAPEAPSTQCCRAPRPAQGTQRGQGMTEYLIVVALIAVAAIGVYTLFGQTLRNQTAGLALEISGQDAGAAITGAQTSATGAQTAGATRKGLENFNQGNH